MSTITVEPVPVGAAKRARTTGERLVSLDAFRGLTMLLLISHGFGIYEFQYAKNPGE